MRRCKSLGGQTCGRSKELHEANCVEDGTFCMQICTSYMGTSYLLRMLFDKQQRHITADTETACNPV